MQSLRKYLTPFEDFRKPGDEFGDKQRPGKIYHQNFISRNTMLPKNAATEPNLHQRNQSKSDTLLLCQALKPLDRKILDDTDQFEFDISMEQGSEFLNFDGKPSDQMNDAIQPIDDHSAIQNNDTDVLKAMLDQVSFKDQDLSDRKTMVTCRQEIPLDEYRTETQMDHQKKIHLKQYNTSVPSRKFTPACRYVQDTVEPMPFDYP